MDSNKISVTREYEWTIRAIGQGFAVSEMFEIALFDMLTKCQLIVFFSQEKMWIHLHKLEMSSDNFLADLNVSLTNPVNNAKKDLKRQCLDGKIFKLRCSWIVFELKDFFGDCKSCEKLIKLNVAVIIKENKPEDVEHAGVAKLLSNYGKLFNTDKLSDFKFICSDKKEIPTHRFVLIAHSPVMYKMLMAPMIESKTHQVKLSDIDGETMLEVLRFLYTGKVEDVKTLAPNLLYCAEKYEMTELKNFAAASMADNLTIDNVLEYFMLADRYDENYLLGKCIFYIKQNFKIIQKHRNWIDFNSKTKTLIQMFMADHDKHQVRVLKSQSSPILLSDTSYVCMRLNLQGTASSTGYLYKLT